MVDTDEFTWTGVYFHIMECVSLHSLSSTCSEEELEVWWIHKDHLDILFQHDDMGGDKKVPFIHHV
jgi:hypothetical protein